MDSDVVLLDVDGIDPPGDAVRDRIDPDRVRELAESIRSQGLLQPILVRPLNGRFEVVAGHRRWLAHRLLGLSKIKCFVRELSEEDTVLIRAIENDQREDLNPIEKAKVYRRLKDAFGWSPEKIAEKMGRSNQTIRKHLRLLDLPEEFHDAVARGALSMSVALCLDEIDDSEFKSYYLRCAIDNGVTLDVARGWVEDWKKCRAGGMYSAGGSGGDGVPLVEVTPVFQTCVCCHGPVENRVIRYIGVCPDCEREIRGALKGSR